MIGASYSHTLLPHNLYNDFMAEDKKIPLIPEIPQELLRKILMGEVVVFIGSGVSRLAGVPSWKDLALKYLEEWRVEKKLQYDVFDKLKREKSDPLELLTICAGVLGADKVKERLKSKLLESLTDDKTEYILRIYGYIRDLKTGYVTTNYDDFLEKALPTVDDIAAKENECLQVLEPGNTIALNQVGLNDNLDIPVGKIVYLHGKALNPNDIPKGGIENKIILTLEDYLEHYRDFDKGWNGKSFLKKVFNKTFLFIGLGLKEFEIIQHIQKPSINTNHYLLLGISNYEGCISTEYINYYNILNIKPIFYNISNNGYHQLEDVLMDWSNKVRTARVKSYESRIESDKDIKHLKKIQELKNEGFE